MIKPKHTHLEPVRLTRSMSFKVQREFNNTRLNELNELKETSNQLEKKTIDRMDWYTYCYLCANLLDPKSYYKGDNN